MFCAVVNVKTSPNNLGKFVKVFKEQSIPVESSQKGFRGAYLLTKPNGDILMLHIWDSEELEQKFVHSAEHDSVAAHLKPLFASTPGHEGYDVPAYAVK